MKRRTFFQAIIAAVAGVFTGCVCPPIDPALNPWITENGGLWLTENGETWDSDSQPFR
jgi:hypothetical protein